MSFELHPNLEKKIFICDLALCCVLLENEMYYPWIFLVPRIPNVCRIMDLSLEDQYLLTKECDLAQKILWEIFSPFQINVAAIGNKTPQLHVHVIARYATDPAWPGTVWDHPVRHPLSPHELERRKEQIQKGFKTFTKHSTVSHKPFS